ncbi:hypothetical protein FACS1894219_04970 [Clostridia bacterium]|nr:hypothetical protein FACS1894219_04970 [Clostridia bacterium]
MVEKLKGCVIGVRNSGDGGKRLTLFTAERGKIYVTAPSSRSFKYKHMASVQLYAYSEFTVFGGDGFMKLNEAALIEEFSGLRNSFTALSLAAYLADALSEFSRGDDTETHEPMLRLFLNALYLLSEERADERHVKSAFEIKLLAIAGFPPDTDEIDAEVSVIEAIKYIIDADPSKAFSFKLDSEDSRSLSRIAEKSLLSENGFMFDSLKFYNKNK